MTHRLKSSFPWLLLVFPVGALILAMWIVLHVDDSPDHTSAAWVFPSPPAVTFVPPTPLPTVLPTSPPAQEGLVGKPLPAFTLTTLDGGTLELTQLEGQIVFLNFWATWCVPCREEMPALQSLQDEYSTEGIVVIAVTDPTLGQTEEEIHAFLALYDLTLTVALSSDPLLYETFGVAQIPTTVVTDRQGIVVYRKIGALQAEDITGYLDYLLPAAHSR